MPELVAEPLVDAARAALIEITPEATIGELVSVETNDEGVSTVLFASTMAGYPDWHWTVSVAQLPDESPSVLEAELLPGDGALLAPDWVPWSDRLEDYKAAQAAIAAGELAEGDDDDSDDEDSDDEDSDDDDSDDEDSDDEDSDDDSDDEYSDDLDDDLDEHDLHGDDLGDDPDDGIDFESDEALAAVSASVGVDEQDEPEAEADEDGPEPPAAPRRQQRRQRKQ
jgi:hypothetical protein